MKRYFCAALPLKSLPLNFAAMQNVIAPHAANRLQNMWWTEGLKAKQAEMRYQTSYESTISRAKTNRVVVEVAKGITCLSKS